MRHRPCGQLGDCGRPIGTDRAEDPAGQLRHPSRPGVELSIVVARLFGAMRAVAVPHVVGASQPPRRKAKGPDGNARHPRVRRGGADDQGPPLEANGRRLHELVNRSQLTIAEVDPVQLAAAQDVTLARVEAREAPRLLDPHASNAIHRKLAMRTRERLALRHAHPAGDDRAAARIGRL